MRGRRPRRECQFASDPSHQPRSSATCTASSSQIRREREGSIARHRTSGEMQRGQGESCPSPPPHAAHRLRDRLKTSPVPATTPRFATNATSPRTLSFIASFVKSSHPSSHARNRRAPPSLASSSVRSVATSSAACWLMAFCASTATHVATIASLPSLVRGAGSVPPVAGGEWRIQRPTSSIASFLRFRFDSGCSRFPTHFGIAVPGTLG